MKILRITKKCKWRYLASILSWGERSGKIINMLIKVQNQNKFRFGVE